MTSSFEALGLSRDLLDAVKDMGFEEPSPIQNLAIPALLAGKDIIGQAQTGTGKTAAFGLPVLEKLTFARQVQALILCPTRELAIQVAEELNKLAGRKKGLSILPIYGGQSIERQFRALERGAQVIVGTPGRIIDHMQRGTLHLNKTRIAVLDEADEMLAMGFREDIETILEQTPADCQRVLFSATMPQPILELSKRFLHDPQTLTIPHKMLTVPSIEQVCHEVRPYQKMDALCRVLDVQGFHKSLVFCSTKRSVDEVSAHLQQRGYQSDALHGDLNQVQRDRVMARFRTDGLEVLVATDVAARGIDVDDVDAVFNYDIPHDVEGYVHRIGRTGRAGRAGKAFTFVTPREQYKIRDIIRYTKASITQAPLPTLRDVNDIRTAKLLAEVRQTLTEGQLERWQEMIETFLNESAPDGDCSAHDLAAALLKLLMQRDYGKQEPLTERDTLAEDSRRAVLRAGQRSDHGENAPYPTKQAGRDRGGNTSMTRLHINIGHLYEATPRTLVGAITGECGIPGRAIGAIEIQPRFSLVDVAPELADAVLAGLNKGVFICGVRVIAKKDGGAPAARPRKPLPPGLRHQHPAKFGKKPRGATSSRNPNREPRRLPDERE